MRLNYEKAMEAIAAKVGIDLAQFAEGYDIQKAAISDDLKKENAIEVATASPAFEPSGVLDAII